MAIECINGSLTTDNAILQSLSKRCDCDIPFWLCPAANIAGLCSTVVWFLVLLPQIWKSYRARSVDGVSFNWALMNFTAAFNNLFFCFKLGTLPLYSYVSATYLSVLTGFMLVLFFIYTPHTRTKYLTYIACGIIWAAIVFGQLTFDIYQYMEWLSITLWSIETFPQLFLNIRRRSTKGLSNASVLLTTFGKTTDFANTYILRMPMQYVIMAYFSSTTAFINTLQVLHYWNRQPIDLLHEDENLVVTVSERSSMLNKSVRLGMQVVLCFVSMVFNFGVVYRTGTYFAIGAPILTYSVVALALVYYYHKQANETEDDSKLA